MPRLVLADQPPEARSTLLVDVLDALGAKKGGRLAQLQGLWINEPGAEPNPPRLRQGLEASFLLVSPAPEGRIDFTATGLTAVWLDGHEIEGTH